ncbi:MAG: archaellin/type IV pilin N-terminal domain-containing protein [Candidatus Hodarchaeales archaeon]
MKIQRIIRKRRAVSPILAAILLIGLAVAAGAVLFVVVLPMITSPGGTLTIDDTTTFSNATLHLVLKNEGTDTATIRNVTVINSTGDGHAVFTFNGYTVPAGARIKDYNFDDVLAEDTWTVTVTFTVGNDAEVQTLTRDFEI